MQNESGAVGSKKSGVKKVAIIALFGMGTFALVSQGLFASNHPVIEPAFIRAQSEMPAPHDAAPAVDRSLEDRAQIEMSVAAYNR